MSLAGASTGTAAGSAPATGRRTRRCPALRHRPDQAARAGGRGSDARHGQEAGAGARHAPDDRKHAAADTSRLKAPTVATAAPGKPPGAVARGRCPDPQSSHESALGDAGQTDRAPQARLESRTHRTEGPTGSHRTMAHGQNGLALSSSVRSLSYRFDLRSCLPRVVWLQAMAPLSG